MWTVIMNKTGLCKVNDCNVKNIHSPDWTARAATQVTETTKPLRQNIFLLSLSLMWRWMQWNPPRRTLAFMCWAQDVVWTWKLESAKWTQAWHENLWLSWVFFFLSFTRHQNHLVHRLCGGGFFFTRSNSGCRHRPEWVGARRWTASSGSHRQPLRLHLWVSPIVSHHETVKNETYKLKWHQAGWGRMIKEWESNRDEG